jgi:hydroxymethylbilane synthase
MRRLGAGCYLPVAAYANIVGSELSLTGLVTSLDGTKQVRLSQSIPWASDEDTSEAERLGIELAEQSLQMGAGDIIRELNVNEEERQHV